MYLYNSFSKDRDINILEIGFGTGLNCYLTKLNQKNNIINYTALEPYPIPLEAIQLLNYKNILDKETEFFDLIHQSGSNCKFSYKERFNFEFINEGLESFESSKKYDLIYFDGFAKKKDSRIWKINNINKLTKLLSDDGIMITYASNSYLKNTVVDCGLRYEVLPGALEKREMLRVSW